MFHWHYNMACFSVRNGIHNMSFHNQILVMEDYIMTKTQAERRFDKIVKHLQSFKGRRIVKDGKVFILRRGEKPCNGWKYE